MITDVAMVSKCALVFFALFAYIAATDVKQCKGKSINVLKDSVEILGCNRPPCKLKKKTSLNITIKFTVDKDTPDLKNNVEAEVFNVPLPFVGVDGVSICDKVYNESGEKVDCPLKAGTTYVYKDSFPIHDWYPEIAVLVRWAFEENKNTITCFEVPAKIIK